MAMEKLFRRGMMTMGPSSRAKRNDPSNIVGVFDEDFACAACEWRLTLTKRSADEFRYLNEEQLPDGRWSKIDEWLFRRKR